MKALKIVGVILLVLWMAWVTRQLLTIHSVLNEVCGEVYADIAGWNIKNKHEPPKHPTYQCDWVDLIYRP